MPLTQSTQKTILLFCFALLISISGIGQSSNTQKREPILGQFLNAETVIDGNAPSVNNQFQISPGSKFTQDKKGNIYVIETEKDRILKVSSDGKSYTVVAGGNGKGSGPNQLNYPQDIFIDDLENIYVADTENHRIQKWAKEAKEGTTVAGGNGKGDKANQLDSPEGILMDFKFGLLIADSKNSRIQQWKNGDKEGITVAGGNGFGSSLNQLKTPNSIYLDSDENLYILTKNGGRIQKWKMGDEKGAEILQAYNYIPSFIVDNEGNIYYSFFDNIINVSKVDKTQTYFTAFSGNQILSSLNNLTINNNNELVLFDSQNARVFKIPLNQVPKYEPYRYPFPYIEASIVFQGNKSKSDINQLDGPTDIFVSDSGSIFINDTKNSRVQKFRQNEKKGETILNFSPKLFYIKGGLFTNNLKKDGIIKWPSDSNKQIPFAGGNGLGNLNNQLDNPSAMGISNAGNIYISDSFNNRILKWKESENKGDVLISLKILGGYPLSLSVGSDNVYYDLLIDGGYGGQKIQKLNLITNDVIDIAYNSWGNISPNFFIDIKNVFYYTQRPLNRTIIYKLNPENNVPEIIFESYIEKNPSFNISQ